MAKRKVIEPIVERFFVAFDLSTGNILSASNEPLDKYENTLEIPYFLYNKIVNDQEHFKNWVVATVDTPEGESVLELMPRAYQSLSFKNSVFGCISDTPTDKTELIVEWNKEIQHWAFSISTACKYRLLTTNLSSDTLAFFVVLESDFDFLIRTIFINVDDLKKEKVYIPFESNFENNITKISVATRTVLRSYGLTIND